jgi:5-methylcytosine-specific restriction endonuclease McrA
MSAQALVLNASFEPLHIVSWQRAIQLLFQGKCEVVEEGEYEIRTVRVTLRAPAVLRLLKYIPLKKDQSLVRFSRSNIFLRDQFRCQYCGYRFPKAQLTLDHVTPVVQGGRKSWENIVTSCKPCNQKKGGRTPAQAELKLIQKPKRPTWLPSTALCTESGGIPDTWKTYFRFALSNADP